MNLFSLPMNRAEAIGILAGNLGSMSHAIQLSSNAGLPGVTQMGASAAALGRGTTAAIPKGAGPIGPLVLVVTAAQVLREAEKANRDRQLLAVVARFNLKKDVDADMLAAEAYLWIQFMGPMVFMRLPNDRTILDKVGQELMAYERANPTTLRRSERGDSKAVSEIRRIVDQALFNLNAGTAEIAVFRTSTVDSRLSASSERCRALLGLTSADWRAHHLIPFAEVAKLPTAVQQAFLKAGCAMDTVHNLIALPANMPTYLSLPPVYGPVHNSAHENYSLGVRAQMLPYTSTALALTPMALLGCLRTTEMHFRTALLNISSGYHPRLTLLSNRNNLA